MLDVQLDPRVLNMPTLAAAAPAPSGRWMVGDRIPAVLTITELSAGIGLSARQIREYTRGGNHPGIVVLAGAGHVRYSGAAVDRWLRSGLPIAPRRSAYRGGR